MPQTPADKRALQKYTQVLLADPTHRPELVREARQDKPGVPIPNKSCAASATHEALTRAQKDHVKALVLKHWWPKLSKEERQQYYSEPSSSATGSAQAAGAQLTTAAAQPAAPPPTLRAAKRKAAPKPKRRAKQSALPHKRKMKQQVTRHGKKQCRRVLRQLSDKVSGKADAVLVAAPVVKDLEAKWPGFLSDLARSALGVGETVDFDYATAFKQIMTGLAEIPGLTLPQCSDALQPVRDHLDSLVRKVLQDQQRCREHGYIMGASRWRHTGAASSERRPRGRKSKVNNPELLKMVQEQFRQCSAPSSNLCVKRGTGELVLSHTLTKQKSLIFSESRDLTQAMSASTMRRIVHRHLNEYKNPQCQSDYCQYCYDLDAKVLPRIGRVMLKGKEKLSNLLPGYFTLWDEFEKKHELAHQPGLHLELYKHFVEKHSCVGPCAKHRGTDFPCGLARLRQPGSGFRQTHHVDLHALEAELEFTLKKLQKLLNNYLFHRAANLHQRPCLDKLMAAPPLGHVAGS